MLRGDDSGDARNGKHRSINGRVPESGSISSGRSAPRWSQRRPSGRWRMPAAAQHQWSDWARPLTRHPQCRRERFASRLADSEGGNACIEGVLFAIKLRGQARGQLPSMSAKLGAHSRLTSQLRPWSSALLGAGESGQPAHWWAAQGGGVARRRASSSSAAYGQRSAAFPAGVPGGKRGSAPSSAAPSRPAKSVWRRWLRGARARRSATSRRGTTWRSSSTAVGRGRGPGKGRASALGARTSAMLACQAAGRTVASGSGAGRRVVASLPWCPSQLCRGTSQTPAEAPAA